MPKHIKEEVAVKIKKKKKKKVEKQSANRESTSQPLTTRIDKQVNE